jgi:cytochrome bd-type quinol oxidase subunit 1
MFPPRGIPADVDAETHRRIAHTFFVLRMVNGGLLLVFLAVVVLAIELRDWPRTATVVVALMMLGLAAFLVSTWVRCRRLGITRRPAASP